VMRAASDDPGGVRLRGLIVVLWRSGLRISEPLALTESDLDAGRGAILVRHGKGGKRREVGMDRWAWEQLAPWLALRATLPLGALVCVLRGPTRGRSGGPRACARNCTSGRSRQAAPTVRPASAAPCACGGDVARGRPTPSHQRQLGHASLAITSVYLRGIDNTEIVHTVHERPAPTIPAHNGLQLH
jgi:integrase